MRSRANTDKLLRHLNRRKFPVVIVLLIFGTLLVAGAGILILLYSGYFSNDRSSEPGAGINGFTVTVPWNAGSLADLTVRALTGSEVDNISGSNGAAGINEVYSSPRDGLNILGTNLSSMVLSKLTGFTETGVGDWEFWFFAFSPCIAAVRADSEIATVEDLLSVPGLTAANAGGGTMSYIAAHIFAERYGITLNYRDYPGTNPAVKGIQEGAADFIIAPRSDIAAFLNSGELREIETDRLFNAENSEWGEFYGLMLPKGAKEDTLLYYDKLLSKVASGVDFLSFLAENGLLQVRPDRKTGGEIAAGLAEMIEKTLLGSGYLR